MSFSDDTRPVVITGATGQLGTAFSVLLPGAVMLGRSDLDLTSPSTVADVIQRLDPSAVINCAAYTNVDGAEHEGDIATSVNGESVGALALATDALKIPFLTFSTDYVFSGDAFGPYVESSHVDPINAYGRSKLLGEQLAINNNPNSLVVRTSWLVSATHDNFVSTILRMAGDAGSEVRVVADQAGCPTIAGDLAVAALTAMNNRVTGLLHLVNGPATTWFDLARFAVACARLPGTVVPCTTAEFPRPAVRPVNSVLASERLQSWPSILLPSWHDSIPLVVDAQMKRIPSGG